MADNPITDIINSLKGGIGVGVSLPGEVAFTALLNFLSQARATMDPEIRKRYDTVMVQQYEDLQAIWRKLWVDAGVLK